MCTGGGAPHNGDAKLQHGDPSSKVSDLSDVRPSLSQFSWSIELALKPSPGNNPRSTSANSCSYRSAGGTTKAGYLTMVRRKCALKSSMRRTSRGVSGMARSMRYLIPSSTCSNTMHKRSFSSKAKERMGYMAKAMSITLTTIAMLLIVSKTSCHVPMPEAPCGIGRHVTCVIRYARSLYSMRFPKKPKKASNGYITPKHVSKA
mmetsp:Transcript_112451/g.312610  ORF Transcript_112451/g.312610 Transcript_112451/m.312610 type:complete len:204 (+) Transcript_112451:242-853(+)